MRKATVEDVGALSSVLAAAFYEDPIFSWLIPDDSSRLRRLGHFFAFELREMALKHGRAYTTDQLQGAALTMEPGRWRMPMSAMLEHRGTFVKAYGRRLGRASGFLIQVERHHLRGPHYYFACIGVGPESQGKGLGSSLMGPTLERCDREGLAAYLEASSERNAALYERLGFEVTGELRFRSSPTLWLMRRPAGPAQSGR